MKFYVWAVWLGILGVIVSSCTTWSPNKSLSVTDARNAVVSFLQAEDIERSPGSDLNWREDEVTLTALHEELTRFTAEAWVITVIAMVPGTGAYEVRVSNGRMHLHWRGVVDSHGKVTEISKEESLLAAERFLRDSPTFKFDGIEDSLIASPINTSCIVCALPFQYQFSLEFDSEHPGYGDRSGEILSQEITHHRAVISIDRLTIKTAVMDDTWDMLGQEMIIRPGN